MNKKLFLSILIILSLILITGCNLNSKTNNTNKEIKSMKVIINENEYKINLEDNTTVNSFINLLPLVLEMEDLNDNEKYVNLETSLPTNPYKPKTINKGDVMLFGNNCLVIFYKSFDTTYNYTKIGHIDNLPDLGKDKVKIKIT